MIGTIEVTVPLGIWKMTVAIREAAGWYKKHLTASLRGNRVPEIVLLTNDQANLGKSKEAGIAACSSTLPINEVSVIVVEQYIKDLPDGDMLMDMISTLTSTDIATKRPANIYPEHLSSTHIQSLIQSGRLHSGVLTISPYNFLEATVSNPRGKPYLIVGRENINRAVHGDVVAIEVLPEDEWRGTSDTIVEEGDIAKEENADDEDQELENEVDAREKRMLKSDKNSDKTIQVTAKVVGIVKRNWRTYTPSLLKQH